MDHYVNKIYGFILNVISKIILLFSEPINGRVLIGCSEGKFYNGNSKQLFETMISQGRDVFFITRNKQVFNDLKRKYGNNVVYSYSMAALRVFVSSKVIVVSHAVYDITPFDIFHKNKKVVNLWHGFTFKTIGALVNGLSEESKEKIKSIYSKTELMISSSEAESEILSKSFGVDISKIKVTGYPRYDLLTHQKDKSILEKLSLPKDKKLILYAPTFRDVGDFSIFPFDDFSSEKLYKFLEDTNSILLLRFHKNDLNKVESKIEFNDRIINFNQKVLEEVNDILPFVDLLITDYSSILMDYVLLDKPMIFFPYDIEEYKKTRGFNFEVDSFYPGRSIFSFKQFLSDANLLLNDSSIDKTLRDQCLNKFHQYKKGNSTQAVIDLIEQL